MRAWIVVWCCLLGLARADVVHLTTGRSISGEVIKEDDQSVVVKTPDGKLTLPRRIVARIERQSRGETLIELARDHDRAGATDKARALYERAAESDDPEVAERARAELARLERRRERAKTFRDAPRTPLALPPGIEGLEPLEGKTLQEQLDRGRKALEDGIPRRALRLLEPLQAAAPDDPNLAYLRGRALELQDDAEGAGPHYRQAAGRLFRRDAREPAWLGELARRALSGEDLQRDSPAVERDWQRDADKHVAVFHRLADPPSWLVSDAEAILLRGLQRLEIQYRELQLAGRIQVFVVPQADYRFAARFAQHGDYPVAPDGHVVKVYATAERSTYQRALEHEMGHLAAFEVAPELPRWCAEAAAIHAEGPEVERAWRGRAAQRADAWPELEAFLAGDVDRAADPRLFDAYACLLFESLCVLKETPRKVFKLALLVAEDGPRETLRRFKLDRDQVTATMRRLAGLE